MPRPVAGPPMAPEVGVVAESLFLVWRVRRCVIVALQNYTPAASCVLHLYRRREPRPRHSATRAVAQNLRVSWAALSLHCCLIICDQGSLTTKRVREGVHTTNVSARYRSLHYL